MPSMYSWQAPQSAPAAHALVMSSREDAPSAMTAPTAVSGTPRQRQRIMRLLVSRPCSVPLGIPNVGARRQGGSTSVATLRSRGRFGGCSGLLGEPLVQAPELLLEMLDLVVREILEVHELRARTLDRADELVELKVQRLGVAVLRVLDQEHHQEREDRGARVDDELPRVRVVKGGARHGPRDHQHQREEEREW